MAVASAWQFKLLKAVVSDSIETDGRPSRKTQVGPWRRIGDVTATSDSGSQTSLMLVAARKTFDR